MTTGAGSPALAGEFKFPAMLCVYRYSMVSERNPAGAARTDLYGFDTGEQALRIKNIHDNKGELSAEFDIPDSLYRFRFEAKITQDLKIGTNAVHKSAQNSEVSDELRIQTFLEKKDASSGLYSLVGQKTVTADAKEFSDGMVNKNVYARAANQELNHYRDSDGKIDPLKVSQAIKQGTLSPGTVFNAGPVCGLMDLATIKQVTSHTAELADLLAGVQERGGTQVINFPHLNSAPKVAFAPAPTPTPTPTPISELFAPQNEFDQAYPELSANAQAQANEIANERANEEIQVSQQRDLASAEAEARSHYSDAADGTNPAPVVQPIPSFVPAETTNNVPPSNGSAF